MGDNKRAVFFCSASDIIDPKYNQAARDVVRAACSLGYDIVSGGTSKGTMRVVCEAARECGAKTIGILPLFMHDFASVDLDETVWTGTMSERKEKLREGVSLVVALPGGIGTMDELMETLVLVKLKRMSAKLVAFNLDGFYEPLRNLLDHFVKTGMMTHEDMDLLVFADDVDSFKKAVAQ